MGLSEALGAYFVALAELSQPEQGL
jgi:hypothetical protein